jgi:hypothetical protein
MQGACGYGMQGAYGYEMRGALGKVRHVRHVC